MKKGRQLVAAFALAGMLMVAGCIPQPMIGASEDLSPLAEAARKAVAGTSDQSISGLWVVGAGGASAAPEVAEVRFGVDLSGENPAELVDEAARRMDGAVSAIGEMGVAEEDIKTVDYSLRVETVRDPDTGRPSGQIVYHVSHQSQATVRELDAVGDILAALVDAGANTISQVHFGVEDRAALLEQARRDAIQDASDRAAVMAEELGIVLGAPILVTEGSLPAPLQSDLGIGGGQAVAEAAAPSISPGDFSVSVRLQVVYEIAK